MDQNTCLIEWERLDMIAGGYTPDFIDICREFVKEIPLLLSALDDSLQAGDVEKVLRTAHQIKGSAANFGFVGVSIPMEQIESSAREGSLEGAVARLDQARNAFKLGCAEFAEKQKVSL